MVNGDVLAFAGGGMSNDLAVNVPSLKAAVAFYGRQPAAADVPKIKAAVQLHYAGLDERIDAGIPAYEEALKKAGVTYELYMYDGVNHAFHNDTAPTRFLLNAQRRQAGADSMVLQRDRRTKHRHDAVTGELAHRAAVALHHRRGTVQQVGHDLAQPLRTHRRRDVHRMHHIGEQHRDLLVLRRCRGGRDRRTALVTELRVRRQLRTARPAHHGCRRHVTPPPHGRSRRYRVTAGQPTCAISRPRSGQRVARYAVPRGVGGSGRIPPMCQVGAGLV